MLPMRLADFDYALPPELIAQHPLARRSSSRLLVVDTAGGALHDRLFDDLVGLLDAGDLLVLNDTRVIAARLAGHKPTGGRLEVMIERVTGERSVLAQIRASRAPPPGSTFTVAGSTVRVLARDDRFFELEFDTGVQALIEQHGAVPLPPYIARPAGQPAVGRDAERYQTVYARVPGAVAAPTAGLHFTPELLAALRARGVAQSFVTLHVGAGTFVPVKSDDIAMHRMHAERFEIPAATSDAILRTRSGGGRIVAAGTTTLRALESASTPDGTVVPGSAETRLFITPGYRFRVVDRLITNFHLPRSTLLMLVAAFAGHETIMAAYRHAIEHRYRFFSYGDAMLLTRR